MKRFALTILLTVLTFGETQAQDFWNIGPQIDLGYGLGFGYGVGVGYGYGYGYGAASTPESAAGHAAADLIRSEGFYNSATSEALVNFEEARRQYIQNQRQWAEVYLLKKQALEAQHTKAREVARARNARYLEYVENHYSSNVLPRLASSQLDPTTGKIMWPSALLGDSFTVHRSEIELLLSTRARTGSTSEVAVQITNKTRELHEALRAHIRQIVTQEYLEAYRFLASLSLEGRYPFG